jgi:uncharacterized membrane protein
MFAVSTENEHLKNILFIFCTLILVLILAYWRRHLALFIRASDYCLSPYITQNFLRLEIACVPYGTIGIRQVLRNPGSIYIEVAVPTE